MKRFSSCAVHQNGVVKFCWIQLPDGRLVGRCRPDDAVSVINALNFLALSQTQEYVEALLQGLAYSTFFDSKEEKNGAAQRQGQMT